jgi:hypothetical protein
MPGSIPYRWRIVAPGDAAPAMRDGATGRRVTRTAGGTTTRFYFDGSQIPAEKQGSATTAVYTYGDGRYDGVHIVSK